MKFVHQIIPRRFLRNNHKSPSPSLSRSQPSFTSSCSSNLSDTGGGSTPISVLPTKWSSDVLKRAFEMIDRDGDGKILKEEFEALLVRLGSGGGSASSKEEVELMVSEVDGDGDGCITLEEFNSIGSAFAPPTCDEEMRETFEFFDGNGDGRITAEELLEAFTRIGEGGSAGFTLEECRKMIQGVDRNGDGYVCLEDFSRMMNYQRLR